MQYHATQYQKLRYHAIASHTVEYIAIQNDTIQYILANIILAGQRKTYHEAPKGKWHTTHWQADPGHSSRHWQ